MKTSDIDELMFLNNSELTNESNVISNVIYGTISTKKNSCDDELENIKNACESIQNKNGELLSYLLNDFEIRSNLTDSFDSINEKKSLKKEVEIIKNSINACENRIKKNYINSYFYRIKEYIGIVERIFEEENEKFFECSLNNTDSDNVIMTKFSFEDIFYESDRCMVKPGAQFIFITGKRREVVKTSEGPKLNGTRNMAEIYFRRTRNMNKKEIEYANELQDDWSKLFSD